MDTLNRTDSAVNRDDFDEDYLRRLEDEERRKAVAWAAAANTGGERPAVPGTAAAARPGSDAPTGLPGYAAAAQAKDYDWDAYGDIDMSKMTLGANMAEMPGAIGHGVTKGLNSAKDFIYEGGGEWIRNATPDIEGFSVNFDFRDGNGGYTFPKLSVDRGKTFERPEIPQLFDQPETPLGVGTSGISQFGTGYVAGGAPLRGVKAVSTLGRAAKGAAQGGIADFVFFDGKEGRLSDLIQEYPALQNPVSEFLASSPDDSELEGRFKNFVEGLGLGVLAEEVLHLAKAARQSHWAAKQTGTAGEAAETALSGPAREAVEPAYPKTVGFYDPEPPQSGMIKTLSDPDGPLTDVRLERTGRNPAEADRLETSGYAVDYDVYDAPVAMDGKLRYGVTREALEKEGVLGERVTRVDTTGREWPKQNLERGRLSRKEAYEWRMVGREEYEKVRGEYRVAGSGDVIVLGDEGVRHGTGQGQNPDAIKLFPYLPELIEKSFKLGEFNPHKSTGRKKDPRPTLIYQSAIELDGRPHTVQIIAKRNLENLQSYDFYDLRVEEWNGRVVLPRPAPIPPLATELQPLHPREMSDPTLPGSVKVAPEPFGNNIDASTEIVNKSSGIEPGFPKIEEVTAWKGDSAESGDILSRTTELQSGRPREISDPPLPGSSTVPLEPFDTILEGIAKTVKDGDRLAHDLSQVRVVDFLSDAQGVVSAEQASNMRNSSFVEHFHVNFAKIESAQDIKDILHDITSFHETGQGGNMPVMRQLDNVPLTPEREMAWSRLKEGRATPLEGNAELAARNLWLNTGDRLKKSAGLAMANPTPENVFAFRKMLEVSRAVNGEIAGKGMPNEEALKAWSLPEGAPLYVDERIAELVEEAGGTKATGELARRVYALEEAGMLGELDSLVRKSPGRITVESVRELTVNALLALPPVHIGNLGLNSFAALGQVLDRAVAGRMRALDRLMMSGELKRKILAGEKHPPMQIQPGEALALLQGWLGMSGDTVRLTAKMSRLNEAATRFPGKVSSARPSAVSAENWNLARDTSLGRFVDMAGELIRTPESLLRAEDELFQAGAYRGEFRSRAYRQARRDIELGNVPPDQFQARFRQIMDTPAGGIRGGIDAAKYTTFSNAPEGVAGMFARMARDVPGLNFIAPFLKTSANVFNYTVAQRSPLAPLFRSFREDMASDGPRRQLALARVATGTTLMTTLGGLAFGGAFTGGGPADPAERERLEKEGWQPYSVKVGEQYVPFNRNDALGTTLAALADLAEAANHLDYTDREADLDEAAVAVIAAMASQATGTAFLRGIGELMELVEGDPAGAEATMARLGGLFAQGDAPGTPNAYLAEAARLVADARHAVPGLSETLPPRRDLWGRVLPYRQGMAAFEDALSFIGERRLNPQPVDRELERLEKAVAPAGRRVMYGKKTVDLTLFEGAADRYAALAGNELRHPVWGLGCMDFLNSVVEGRSPASARYERLADEDKARFLEARIEDYRELARMRLLREYPMLATFLGLPVSEDGAEPAKVTEAKEGSGWPVFR